MHEDLALTIDEHTRVSALLQRPPQARLALALAHGAGAGIRHRFMEAIAQRLVARDVAVLRYQFAYMEAADGKRFRRPDPAPRLHAAVRAALRALDDRAGDLPRFAGGKSMGGRMTSQLAAAEGLGEALGVLFFGFPLHSAKRPSRKRADHLADVTLPMLFVNGTRDKLAELELLRPVVAELGERATLHVVEGADHGFSVLKRSGRNDEEVLDELADSAAEWMATRARAAR